MRKIHVLLSFWKNFLILILIESSLDSWNFNLESWSWFLELESLKLILDYRNQISSWTLKCSWFNLELILWFLKIIIFVIMKCSWLLSYAFCHHLCYHQDSLNRSWFIMKLASTISPFLMMTTLKSRNTYTHFFPSQSLSYFSIFSPFVFEFMLHLKLS